MENAQRMGKGTINKEITLRLGDRDRVRILTSQSELHLERDIKPNSYRPFSNIAI